MPETETEEQSMRRWMAGLLAGVLALSLTACGAKQEEAAKDVDLDQVYSDMEAACDWWTEDYMIDIEGEMLELYYPGLGEVEAEKLIIRTAVMSATANEVALVKCPSEEDADKVQGILQARIDYQAGDDENIGGAFYPEAIEAWKKASVQRQGNYVAMIAVDGVQTELEEIFNQSFQ